MRRWFQVAYPCTLFQEGCRPLWSQYLRSQSRALSSWSKGRSDEEYHIGQALRAMMDKRVEVAIHVEKINQVGRNLLPRRAEDVLACSKIRIKCLTHTDTVSDTALRHQLAFVEMQEKRKYPHSEYPTAIFALNLKGDIKAKTLNDLNDAIFGAVQVVTNRGANAKTVLVCGVPNSGKSSLILPLTRDRTLRVKKKKQHHLPKVSSQAGRTLGMKTHVMESRKGSPKSSRALKSITLWDSPGLRPRIENCDPATVALLLATKMTEPFSGYKNIVSDNDIIRLLLQAANNHALISGENPSYVTQVGLDSPTEDPDEFLNAYFKGQNIQNDGRLAVIRKWQNGDFGGLIYTPYRKEWLHLQPPPTLHRSHPIVYMNDAAKFLAQTANGAAPTTASRPSGEYISTVSP